MTEVDPRTASPLDSTSINGQMTDRAIELIGMLNKVIGADGLGTNTFTLLNDELEDIRQTLSIHTVEPDAEDPHWQEKQTVYFGTAHDRLDLIQEKLNENLDNIKNDIASNVSGLFDIISSKDGLFDDYETAITEAKNGKELEQAEQALQNKIVEELTSDTVLDEMINAFFSNIELTIERMDDEIFGLLNDYDNSYSNGSTDVKKFLVTLPNRSGQTGTRPSQIVDTAEDLLTLILQENKEIYEAQFGAGTYTQVEENSFIASQALGNFANGSLKLNADIINLIIEDLGLTDSQLDSIQSSTDFLDLVSQEKLLELAESHYGTTGDQESTLKELLADHLAIETPKYYEDQRSLFDILSGKADASDTSNENVIFNSIGQQISRVSNSTVDLFQYGFDQVTGSNLQETIRRSPLSAISYLESQKAGLGENQADQIQVLIDDLIDKQAQALEFMIEQEEKKTNPDKDAIKDLKKIIKDLDKYEPGKLDSITAKLAEYIDVPEINPSLDLNTFLEVSEQATYLPAIHQALYGNEMREANQINAKYTERQLPNFKADGTPPEDNTIAPPSIGPSPLAAVLARIGDVMLQKAHNLEEEADVPTKEWMDENVQMLNTINNQLSGLGMSSAGEAFVDSLRVNFKEIIKDFFAVNQPKKTDKDNKKSTFDKGEAARDKFNFLVEQGVIDTNTEVKDLKDLVKDLKKINFNGERQDRIDDIGDLNDDIQDLILEIAEMVANGDDPEAIAAKQAEQTALGAQVTSLNTEIATLNTNENILDAGEEVLKLDKDIDGDNLIDGFTKMLDDNSSKYKQSILDYSNSMTDFARDDNDDGVADIVELFKASLDTADLDLDGNGENDFVDIQGIIDKIGGLSDNIQNIYGGMEATTTDTNGDGISGGIEDQSIRRLILLMFVFSMLEAGEWDYRRYEADTSRYQIV